MEVGQVMTPLRSGFTSPTSEAFGGSTTLSLFQNTQGNVCVCLCKVHQKLPPGCGKGGQCSSRTESSRDLTLVLRTPCGHRQVSLRGLQQHREAKPS